MHEKISNEQATPSVEELKTLPPEEIREKLDELPPEAIRVKLDELREVASATDEGIEKLNEDVEALEKRSDLVKRRLEALA